MWYKYQYLFIICLHSSTMLHATSGRGAGICRERIGRALGEHWERIGRQNDRTDRTGHEVASWIFGYSLSRASFGNILAFHNLLDLQVVFCVSGGDIYPLSRIISRPHHAGRPVTMVWRKKHRRKILQYHLGNKDCP